MIGYEWHREAGVLCVMPQSRLEAEDFEALAQQVDPEIEREGVLRGLLIHTETFPGWEDLRALFSHIRFVRDHQAHIERVAFAADGAVATVLPHLADHFIHAEIRHFPFADHDAALTWLSESPPE